MTVTFDLPPQVEQAYRDTAAAKGVAVDALVREAVIAAHAPLSHDKPQHDTPHEDRIPGSGGMLTNAERRQLEGRKSLVELFAESPFKGLNLEFDESEHDKDFGRDIEL